MINKQARTGQNSSYLLKDNPSQAVQDLLNVNLPSSDIWPSILVLWSSPPVEIHKIAKSVVVLYQDIINRNRPVFTTHGQIDKEVIEFVLHQYRNGRAAKGIVATDDEIEKLIRAGINLKSDRDGFDYIYDARALAGYQGPQYAGKRRYLRKFLSTYESEFQIDISGGCNFNRSESINSLFEDWTEYGTQGSLENTHELEALKNARNNVELLESVGSFITFEFLIANKLVGYALMERFDRHNTVASHFFKANLNITGITEWMMSSVSEYFTTNDSNIEFFNHFEDLGIAGLRTSKSSYRPVELVRKFSSY